MGSWGGTMSGLGDLTIVLMKLITWNIQGLGGSKCMLERKNLRQEILFAN